MRKEYDFSKAVPARQWRHGRNRGVGPESPRDSHVDVAPLTRAQMRELDRRIKDSEDRTRYLLVSVMTPRFLLYYNVSEDSYGHNDPRYGTLFKRRDAAEAVRQHLGGNVQVVRCRVNTRGRLVLASIPKLRPQWSARRRRGAV